MQWTGFALTVLVAHGVAKSLMFMSTGAVGLTTNCQNLTELGGLWRRMPATTTAFVVGSAGMVGVLPLGGFWALREGVSTFWYDSPLLVAAILVVNLLNALNLVRVFRLIFLGPPRPKTLRTPEVGWAMAVPMVAQTIVTLLLPLIMARLSVIPDLEYINVPASAAVIVSGLIGCVAGALVKLEHYEGRSMFAPYRMLQDTLAQDFYVSNFYNITVVRAIGLLSRLGAWFDRYIIDGFVNAIGVASLGAGEGLKYSSSGQSQSYLLTITVGVGAIGLALLWLLDLI
jgi:NAD(P)H-quinone oxidoreductase subunit 5